MSRLPAVYHDTSATSTEAGYRWWEHAACVGQPLGVFYPGRRDDPANGLKICAACPVKAPCLAEEAELCTPSDRYGTRGGLPESIRRPRERKPQEPVEEPSELRPCGTAAALKRHQRRGEVCEECRLAARIRRADRDAARATAA